MTSAQSCTKDGAYSVEIKVGAAKLSGKKHGEL